MTDAAETRRRELARLDFTSAFTITGAAHAKAFSVTPSQISQDRRSETYADELAKCDSKRITRVSAKAWVFLELTIDDGLRALADPENAPHGVIHRAFEAVRFILEKTASWTEPAETASFLAALFAPRTGLAAELDPLRAQVAELDSVVTDLEERLNPEITRY